jgi:hypothetical protein
MNVSAPMLNAALQKATEAGLFPRRCTPYEMAVNREIIRSILEAALEEALSESFPLATHRNDGAYSTDIRLSITGNRILLTERLWQTMRGLAASRTSFSTFKN